MRMGVKRRRETGAPQEARNLLHREHGGRTGSTEVCARPRIRQHALDRSASRITAPPSMPSLISIGPRSEAECDSPRSVPPPSTPRAAGPPGELARRLMARRTGRASPVCCDHRDTSIRHRCPQAHPRSRAGPRGISTTGRSSRSASRKRARAEQQDAVTDHYVRGDGGKICCFSTPNADFIWSRLKTHVDE